MQSILFTPGSIAGVVGFILAAVVAAYLISLKGKSSSTMLLAVIMVIWTVRAVLEVLSFSTSLPWELYFRTGSFVFATIALILHVQFAYIVHNNPYPKESKLVLIGNFVLAGLLSALLVKTIVGLPSFVQQASSAYLNSRLVGFCIVFLGANLLWSIVVLFRKARHFKLKETPVGENAASQICSAFAWLSLGIAVALVLIASFFAGHISVEIVIIIRMLVVIFGLGGFALVYINYAAEPSSYLAKLVGMSLISTIAFLGMAGLLLYVPSALLSESGAQYLEGRTVQFEPMEGGHYVMSLMPLEDTSYAGEKIEWETDKWISQKLPFNFSFHGKTWDSIFIHSNGYVSFGTPFQPRVAEDVLGEWEGLAVLFADFNENVGSVNVHAGQDQLAISWYGLPAFRFSNPNQFQLVLHASGTIKMNYAKVATAGAFGVFHSGEHNPLSLLDLQTNSQFTIPFERSLAVAFEPMYRLFAHQKVSILIWLMFIGSAFVIFISPLFFRYSITRPLNALLKGMRRVNEGDLDTKVPIYYKDEVGFLTLNFNKMTRSLVRANNDLTSYATDLELRVEARTEEAMTQAKIAEEARSVIEAQARKLESLDALKTRFFGNISHEFRTPLTLIKGPLEDVINGRYGEVSAQLNGQLLLMQQNADRLLLLINQLLDLTKLDAREMQLRASWQDLVAIIRKSTAMFESAAAAKEVALQFDALADEALCFVEADKIEKVVANLLSNALKFTTNHGKIRVAIQQEMQSDQEGFKVIVKDTGVGILKEEIEYVFDRFKQTSATEKGGAGTGIGLALVKELVELHGGQVQVDSEPGFGSAFMFWIPAGRHHLSEDQIVALDDPLQEQPSAEAWTDTSLIKEGLLMPDPVTEGIHISKTASVLIVDDHADIRAYVAQHLSIRYQVEMAENGKAGLTLARTIKPDLIISDVMMPEMDGYEFCAAIRADAQIATIPVILLTAKGDEDSRMFGLEHGADDYITKPFSALELLTRAENLIDIRKKLSAKYSDSVSLGPGEIVVSSADAQFIERVRDTIVAQMGNTNFSVDLLADEVGLSKRQLQRKVKSITGLSTAGYIRSLRLERAAQLLEQAFGTVSEVAYAVGFRDTDHFSKLFKQIFGVSPSQYPRDETSLPGK